MFERKLVPSLLAATLVCGALLGCGGDPVSLSPPAPPGTAASLSGGVATANGNSVLSFHATNCETERTANASGVFGPQGGTLIFGTSRLIIPGGALRETVTITATIPDGDNKRVEFQPHGLQFAKPAGLLLDTSGCSMDGQLAPNVWYLSETGVVLETIPASYDPHWHTIAAAIWHFSGYAIAF